MKQAELLWQKSGADSFYAYLPETEDRTASINSLKQKGLESGSGRARLCFHDSPSSSLHVMLIYHDERTKVPIHRHKPYGEYIILVEGLTTVKLFEDQGSEKNKITLTPKPLSTPIYIPPCTWHTLVFDSPSLFYEISVGPLNVKTTEYAR